MASTQIERTNQKNQIIIESFEFFKDPNKMTKMLLLQSLKEYLAMFNMKPKNISIPPNNDTYFKDFIKNLGGNLSVSNYYTSIYNTDVQ